MRPRLAKPCACFSKARTHCMYVYLCVRVGRYARQSRLLQYQWAQVMEARRLHVESCEQQMKEKKCVIDADQALAMGAHKVREVERTPHRSLRSRTLVQDSPP